MIFANVEYLFLLVLLIPYVVWYVMQHRKMEPSMQVSTTRMYMKAPRSWKVYLVHAPFLLRVVTFVMIVLVLARPQTTDNWQNTEIEGIGTATTDLGEFLVTTVMMNDEREYPYATANAEGNIRFDDSNYDIKFQGVAAGKLDYSLDGWCVSFPQAFNSIPNDKGVVIKNMQNYMSTYEYTYDEPGTYNAVFVGRNANYLGTNEKVKELSIIIMDKLYFGDDEDGTGSGETE